MGGARRETAGRLLGPMLAVVVVVVVTGLALAASCQQLQQAVGALAHGQPASLEGHLGVATSDKEPGAGTPEEATPADDYNDYGAYIIYDQDPGASAGGGDKRPAATQTPVGDVVFFAAPAAEQVPGLVKMDARRARGNQSAWAVAAPVGARDEPHQSPALDQSSGAGASEIKEARVSRARRHQAPLEAARPQPPPPPPPPPADIKWGAASKMNGRRPSESSGSGGGDRIGEQTVPPDVIEPLAGAPEPAYSNQSAWLPVVSRIPDQEELAESLVLDLIKTPNSQQQQQQAHNVYYWRLVWFVLPLGATFGNLLVIIAVYLERSLQSVTNYFIVSLAFADLFVGLIVMPFAVYVLVNEVWELGDTICDIFVAVDVTSSTASILNLVAISIDRYRAIAYPIAYTASSSSTIAVLTICGVWLISCAVGTPIIFGLNTTPGRRGDLCILYNSTFIFWSSLASFYIPCLVMVALYWRVFSAIRSRTKKALQAAAQSRPTAPAQNRKPVDEPPPPPPPLPPLLPPHPHLEPLPSAAAHQPSPPATSSPVCPPAARESTMGLHNSSIKLARRSTTAECPLLTEHQLNEQVAATCECRAAPTCGERLLAHLEWLARRRKFHLPAARRHLAPALALIGSLARRPQLPLGQLKRAPTIVGSPQAQGVVQYEVALEWLREEVEVEEEDEAEVEPPPSIHVPVDANHFLVLLAERCLLRRNLQTRAPQEQTECLCCGDPPARLKADSGGRPPTRGRPMPPGATLCLLEPASGAPNELAGSANKITLLTGAPSSRLMMMAHARLNLEEPLEECGALMICIHRWPAFSGPTSSAPRQAFKWREARAHRLCDTCLASCALCSVTLISQPVVALGGSCKLAACSAPTGTRSGEGAGDDSAFMQASSGPDEEAPDEELPEVSSVENGDLQVNSRSRARSVVSSSRSTSRSASSRSSGSSTRSSSRSSSASSVSCTTNFRLGSDFYSGSSSNPAAECGAHLHTGIHQAAGGSGARNSLEVGCGVCNVAPPQPTPVLDPVAPPTDALEDLATAAAARTSQQVAAPATSAPHHQRAHFPEPISGCPPQVVAARKSSTLVARRPTGGELLVDANRRREQVLASQQAANNLLQNATRTIKRRSMRLSQLIRRKRRRGAPATDGSEQVDPEATNSEPDELCSSTPNAGLGLDSSGALAASSKTPTAQSTCPTTACNLQPQEAQTLEPPSQVARASERCLTDETALTQVVVEPAVAAARDCNRGLQRYVVPELLNRKQPEMSRSQQQQQQQQQVVSPSPKLQLPVSSSKKQHRPAGSKRRREKNAAKRERKATKTLAIVLGIFLICWTPFFTCNIIDGVCIQLELDCRPGMIVYTITSWLGYINSCVNPIIYTIFNMEFRRAFKKIICMRRSR